MRNIPGHETRLRLTGPTMANSLVPWGVRIPGMGRSLYVGLTFKFLGE
jgi:hypothetical protein